MKINNKISFGLFWTLWIFVFTSSVFLFTYNPFIEIPRFILIMIGMFIVMFVKIK